MQQPQRQPNTNPTTVFRFARLAFRAYPRELLWRKFDPERADTMRDIVDFLWSMLPPGAYSKYDRAAFGKDHKLNFQAHYDFLVRNNARYSPRSQGTFYNAFLMYEKRVRVMLKAPPLLRPPFLPPRDGDVDHLSGRLPSEALLGIVEHLSIRDAAALMQVCLRFARAREWWEVLHQRDLATFIVDAAITRQADATASEAVYFRAKRLQLDWNPRLRLLLVARERAKFLTQFAAVRLSEPLFIARLLPEPGSKFPFLHATADMCLDFWRGIGDANPLFSVRIVDVLKPLKRIEPLPASQQWLVDALASRIMDGSMPLTASERRSVNLSLLNLATWHCYATHAALSHAEVSERIARFLGGRHPGFLVEVHAQACLSPPTLAAVDAINTAYRDLFFLDKAQFARARRQFRVVGEQADARYEARPEVDDLLQKSEFSLNDLCDALGLERLEWAVARLYRVALLCETMTPCATSMHATTLTPSLIVGGLLDRRSPQDTFQYELYADGQKTTCLPEDLYGFPLAFSHAGDSVLYKPWMPLDPRPFITWPDVGADDDRDVNDVDDDGAAADFLLRA